MEELLLCIFGILDTVLHLELMVANSIAIAAPFEWQWRSLCIANSL
jgi:hypothetical protein